MLYIIPYYALPLVSSHLQLSSSLLLFLSDHQYLNSVKQLTAQKSFIREDISIKFNEAEKLYNAQVGGDDDDDADDDDDTYSDDDGRWWCFTIWKFVVFYLKPHYNCDYFHNAQHALLMKIVTWIA